MKKTFSGQLVKTSNSEDDNLLGLVGNNHEVRILAELLEGKIGPNKQVSVRYLTSNKKLSEDQIDYSVAEIVSGLTDSEYGNNYSEYTGYLWTDEKFHVGGHDLLQELRTHLGKYLYLEIVLTGGEM